MEKVKVIKGGKRIEKQEIDKEKTRWEIDIGLSGGGWG